VCLSKNLFLINLTLSADCLGNNQSVEGRRFAPGSAVRMHREIIFEIQRKFNSFNGGRLILIDNVIIDDTPIDVLQIPFISVDAFRERIKIVAAIADDCIQDSRSSLFHQRCGF